MKFIKHTFIFHLFISVSILPASGGMTYEAHLALSGEGAVISQTNRDVLVGTVKKVEKRVTKNSDPPMILISITEVLRGDPKQESLQAQWSPGDHGEDVRTTKEAVSRIKKWNSQILIGPKVGSKWILVVDYDRGRQIYKIHPIGRFEYSKEKRDWTIKYISIGQSRAKKAKNKKARKEKARDKNVKEWFKDKESSDLSRFVYSADFIGIGHVSSWLGHGETTFEIKSILKGQQKKKRKDNRYFVSVEIPSDTFNLLYEGSRNQDKRLDSLILLLKERDMNRGTRPPKYNLVNKKYGILPETKNIINKLKRNIRGTDN